MGKKEETPLMEVHIFLILLSVGCLTSLRFHSYYGDGMVLQRDVPVNVWGYDELLPGASLECQMLDGQISSHSSLETKAVRDGVWSVELPAMPAGSVCDVEVSGTEEVISLSGVLFGGCLAVFWTV
eukprot:TRINITY_DN4804_c0_g1_i1.p1 TRINITY_DN4804_c0_g1~~TRINITY_DN4804_c0_g1_i1.p1  ORF type:complete len:134 (-),score=46.89 TRINITY_DN4804_c0_g1_i1:179-556(-)